MAGFATSAVASVPFRPHWRRRVLLLCHSSASCCINQDGQFRAWHLSPASASEASPMLVAGGFPHPSNRCNSSHDMYPFIRVLCQSRIDFEFRSRIQAKEPRLSTMDIYCVLLMLAMRASLTTFRNSSRLAMPSRKVATVHMSVCGKGILKRWHERNWKAASAAWAATCELRRFQAIGDKNISLRGKRRREVQLD